MDRLFVKFQKGYDEAERDIRRYLSVKEDYEQDFLRVATAIMESKLNPYGYLPPGWTSIHSNIQACQCFLLTLHHAMVDDGEVCFLTDNHGRPHILFVHRYDFDSEEKWADYLIHNSSVWDHCSAEVHYDAKRFVRQLKKGE
jgi:hypothetical protein